MSSFGDQIITTVESSVDDEFEVQFLHKASTVYARIVILTSALLMAILVWALPKGYTWWAVSPLMPVLVAEFVSMQWLRKYTARPRPYRIHGAELVLYIGMLIIFLVGLAFRLYGFEGYESLSSVGSLFVGAIVGGVTAAILTPKWMRKRRDDDFQRLDKEEDDDE